MSSTSTETPDPPDARSRLVAAAVAAFAEKGFHGTTTRDIASTAGMSPAALYVFFPSKEALLHELSLVGHSRVLELVEESASSAADPVDQLGAVVEAFVRDHAQSHTGARVINYELSALTAEHRAEITALRHRIDLVVRDVVQLGVDQGVFHTRDPHMTTLAVLSLGIDVARWYRDEGVWSPADVAEHYRGLVLAMLGVAPDQ
ncbi:TetR/AcrR family transcriptional regulator [Nocardioides sp.]|uniref:TetR/AcrR family transcriptional regulator n=1 Tax=Nocardioides sp. TaxID=35761 RepID=UPI003D0F9AF2